MSQNFFLSLVTFVFVEFVFVLLYLLHGKRWPRIFSSPGQSPGRAIVLPPASALAAASVLAEC